ncbi:MAG: hypothetical protein KatS3mg085_505 [Candidatus Dojkabacteria bacterium]|nr:MAG: hypothetical protein KatS3mg085_505 [Candidatus Dojkabacteria bacterium]
MKKNLISNKNLLSFLILFTGFFVNILIFEKFKKTNLITPPELTYISFQVLKNFEIYLLLLVYVIYFVILITFLLKKYSSKMVAQLGATLWIQAIFFISTPVSFYFNNEKIALLFSIMNLGFVSSFFTHLFLLIFHTHNKIFKNFILIFIFFSSIIFFNFNLVYSSSIASSFFLAFFLKNFSLKFLIPVKQNVTVVEKYTFTDFKSHLKHNKTQYFYAINIFLAGVVATPIAGIFIKETYSQTYQPNDLLIELLPQIKIAGNLAEIIMQVIIFLFLYSSIRFDLENFPNLIAKVGLIYLLRSFFIILNPLAQLDDPSYKGLIPELTVLFYQGMYFSGHTAYAFYVYLSDKSFNFNLKFLKLILSFLVAALLIISHSHYTIDILMGILAGFFVFKININFRFLLRKFEKLGKMTLTTQKININKI